LLLATGSIGIAAARWRRGHELVYGLCLVASLLIGLDAAAWLLRPATLEQTAILPFGLPWLEAHFRLDALCGLFSAAGQPAGRHRRGLRFGLWRP
jgi:hypothetical protein